MTSVVFFGLTLSENQRVFVAGMGYQSFESRKVSSTINFLRNNSETTTFVDLSQGGNGPERLIAESRGLEGVVMGATSSGNPHRRRAEALGLEQVYVWPEGVLGVLSRNQRDPTMTLRNAERVILQQRFGGPSAQFGGELLNLSASGALIRTDSVPSSRFLFSFGLPNAEGEIQVTGHVVRTRETRTGFEVAVQFEKLDAQAAVLISEFVSSTNIIPVVGTPKEKVRIKSAPSSRQDYALISEGQNAGTAVLHLPPAIPLEAYPAAATIIVEYYRTKEKRRKKAKILETSCDGLHDVRIGWSDD